MEKGTYKGHRVDFKKYAVSRFTPHLFCGSHNSLAGCGACALSLLTGTPPGTIAKKNGNLNHYADDFMVRLLRQQQFKVLELTQCNLSAARNYIGSEHVVLLSQLFKRNEATWGVIFQGLYYHNFYVYGLSELSLLNKPVLSAYVILHPKWRVAPFGGGNSSPKRSPKQGRLTLAALGGIMKSAAAAPKPTMEILV